MTGYDDRFEQNASSLDRWRPDYPAELYAEFLRLGSVARFDVALDVGCGAGQSTAGLFDIANEVIGLEPGEELRASAATRFPAGRFVAGTGEDTGLPDASVDLFAVGTAITWMETAEVLAEAARVLRREGVFVTYAYDFPVLEGDADHVLQRHLTEDWDAHRSARLRSPENLLVALQRASDLEQPLAFEVPNRIAMTVERFVGFIRSTSFGSAYLRTLDDEARYLAEFTSDLREAAGDELVVDFGVRAHAARRY